MDGPTEDELTRSCTRLEADFVYHLQTVGGFGGQSDQLNAYNVFTGDQGYITADRQRYASATAERVRVVAEMHLGSTQRVALSVIPDESGPDVALSDSVTVTPR